MFYKVFSLCLLLQARKSAFTSQICQFCQPDLPSWISEVNLWNLVWSSLLTQGKDNVLLSFFLTEGSWDATKAYFFKPNLSVLPTRPSSLNFKGSFMKLCVKPSLSLRTRLCIIKFFPWPRVPADYYAFHPYPKLTFSTSPIAPWICKIKLEIWLEDVSWLNEQRVFLKFFLWLCVFELSNF